MRAFLIVFFLFSAIPVAAEDLPSIHDGPVAIRPLTIIPKPPKNETPQPVSTPVVVKPVLVHKPVRHVSLPPANKKPSWQDDEIVAVWRSCMAQALKVYEFPPHSLAALQDASANCEIKLLTPAKSSIIMTAIPHNERRDIGCGMWPIGSDADRACANGTFETGETK